MKKTLFAVAAMLLALSACQPDELGGTPNDELTFNITVAEKPSLDGVGTKAVKTGWTAGDCVFVIFFDGTETGLNTIAEAEKYMKLTFNGTQWAVSLENGLTSDDIKTTASDGKGKYQALYLEGVTSIYKFNFIGSKLGWGWNELEPYPNYETVGDTQYGLPAQAMPLYLRKVSTAYTISEENELTMSIDLYPGYSLSQIAVTGLTENDWYLYTAYTKENSEIHISMQERGLFFDLYELNNVGNWGYTKGLGSESGQYDFYGNFYTDNKPATIVLLNRNTQMRYTKTFSNAMVIRKAYRVSGPTNLTPTESTESFDAGNGWTGIKTSVNHPYDE